jgi:hypothetical protein
VWLARWYTIQSHGSLQEHTALSTAQMEFVGSGSWCDCGSWIMVVYMLWWRL